MNEFCYFKDEEFKKRIFEIIEEIISINDNEKECIYQSFRKKENFIKCNKCNLSKNFNNFLNGYYYYGIDFPIWYWKSNVEKNIMLVGQDPFRNENDYSHVKCKDYSTILIGTPYAIGFDYCLNRIPEGYRRVEPYWKFIRLLSSKYNLYITDIFKLFFVSKNDNKKSSEMNYYKKLEIHKNIFNKEIELFKNDLIIFLGKSAPMYLGLIKSNVNICNNFRGNYKYKDKDIEFIILPHLSQRAMRHQIEFLEANGIRYEHGKILSAYYEIICKNIK